LFPLSGLTVGSGDLPIIDVAVMNSAVQKVVVLEEIEISEVVTVVHI